MKMLFKAAWTFCMSCAFAFALSAFVAHTPSYAAQQKEECKSCHTDKGEGKNVHPALEGGCTSCHTNVDASDVPHKFTGKAEKGLSAVGAELCFECHDSSGFKGEKGLHPPVKEGMCTSCHDPHASQHPKMLKKKLPELCFECHDKSAFYGPTIHAPVGLGGCDNCHQPHKSENPKLLTASGSALCFGCHDNADFMKAVKHKPVTDGLCTECHRPHASQFESLLYRRGNLLCRKCHANVEKQPHAISGISSTGHPTSGRRDPARKGKLFSCISCHLPHSSDSMRLFRYKASSPFELCSNCHEGIF